MVRYKVTLWDEDEKKSREYKGWALGSTFAEGAKVVEKYYGNEIMNMTIALYENYEEDVIEDRYFELWGSDSEDI